MPTRCFMPPEIWCGYLCAACDRPTSSSAAWVRSLRRSANTLSTATYTLPWQVSHGSSEWFWNTTPRSGPGPAMCLPARSTVPAVGLRSPATTLSSVLLPQPEWPMSVTNSPLRITRSMPSRIGEEPKDMPSPSTERNLSGPIVEPPGGEHQRLLQQQADDADGEDRDHDVLDLQVVPLVPHPEADADPAGEHLGGDDYEPRDADRGVDDHRPQAADEDDVDRRRVRRLEDEKADRQPRERRHGLEQRDDRRRHAREKPPAADHEAQRDTDERRQAEADADALERAEHVPADALVVRSLHVERIGKDLRRGLRHRDRVGNAAAELGDGCPRHDEEDDARHPGDRGHEPFGRGFSNHNVNGDLAPRCRMRGTRRRDRDLPQRDGAHLCDPHLEGRCVFLRIAAVPYHAVHQLRGAQHVLRHRSLGDRKSTRLNSSHQ